MPILGYVMVVGSVLVALFFVADATLEKGPPPIVTTEQYGLPKSSRPPQVQVLTIAPAPAPDMTSSLVLAASPKAQSASDALAKAETAPKKKRVVRKHSDDYRQNQAWSRDWSRDRYSGGFGGGFFFGRF